jgi:site-specific DNA-methyltransferase (adenine-specific)
MELATTGGESVDYVNQIIDGDCREVMPKLPEGCISACIADPPYNYEFIGRHWNVEEITRRVERIQDSNTLVKNIPYGSGLAGGVRNENWYRRNRENIVQYGEWCYEWAVPLYRVLKQGAFVLVFNSTRTVAHVQVALERAGFYARDILVWRRHSGIPKGFNGRRTSKHGFDEGAWDGWHSCLRNEWEAICVLQKPLLNNYPETLKKTGVGLMHAENGDGFLSNIIEGISNRDKEPEEGVHCTVKPLELMKRLVDLVVPPGPKHVVLDPFVGTGTTAVAAKELGRSYLGIDPVEKYCDCARRRLRGEIVPQAQRSSFPVAPTLFD